MKIFRNISLFEELFKLFLIKSFENDVPWYNLVILMVIYLMMLEQTSHTYRKLNGQISVSVGYIHFLYIFIKYHS